MRWRDRRNGNSSDSASRLVRMSSARSRQRLWNGSSGNREITRRAKGVSIKTTMEELALFMRAWRGYFGFCETPEGDRPLRWVRLRLRAALWRQWKTPRRRRAALVANGVPERTANNAPVAAVALPPSPEQGPLVRALPMRTRGVMSKVMDLRSVGSMRAKTASMTEMVSAAVFPTSLAASVTRDLRSWRTSTGRVRLQMMRSPSQ